PDPSGVDVATERRPAPRRGIALGDDVGVPFQQQAPPVPRLAEPGDDVGATARDLLDVDREAFLGEPALDERGDGGLVAVGISGLDDAGMRTRSRVSATSSSSWICGRTPRRDAPSTTPDAYSGGNQRMTASRRMTRYSSLAM